MSGDVGSDRPNAPREEPRDGARKAYVNGARKAYVKPSFRHERVFETMALACGKIDITQLSCRSNRRNS